MLNLEEIWLGNDWSKNEITGKAVDGTLRFNDLAQYI